MLDEFIINGCNAIDDKVYFDRIEFLSIIKKMMDIDG